MESEDTPRVIDPEE
jgi:hypothetical protein